MTVKHNLLRIGDGEGENYKVGDEVGSGVEADL